MFGFCFVQDLATLPRCLVKGQGRTDLRLPSFSRGTILSPARITVRTAAMSIAVVLVKVLEHLLAVIRLRGRLIMQRTAISRCAYHSNNMLA